MDSNSEEMSIEARLAELEPFIQVVALEVCRDASIRDDVMQEARITACKIAVEHPEVGHGYYRTSVKRSILRSTQRRSWTGSERRRSEAIDPLRRVDRESLDDPLLGFDSPVEDPQMSRVETLDIRSSVRDAVAGLRSDRERELVYLMYWKDQSYNEMSEAVGISKQRVSFYLTQARDKLRESLASLAVA